MRNPKRIPEVLKAIETAWIRVPDLRLGQLIHLLAMDHDPFYIEDDKLLQAALDFSELPET